MKTKSGKHFSTLFRKIFPKNFKDKLIDNSQSLRGVLGLSPFSTMLISYY